MAWAQGFRLQPHRPICLIPFQYLVQMPLNKAVLMCQFIRFVFDLLTDSPRSNMFVLRHLEMWLRTLTITFYFKMCKSRVLTHFILHLRVLCQLARCIHLKKCLFKEFKEKSFIRYMCTCLCNLDNSKWIS